MTLQEIYDKVVNHLRTQNAKSLSFVCDTDEHASCAYRGDGGLKCAAGCLITDELYDNNMEDLAWGSRKV